MKAYVISFIVGAGVGILYAVIRVRSPAPPLVALAGLLGMVLAENSWPQAVAIVAKLIRG